MPKDFSACSASSAFKRRIFSQALQACERGANQPPPRLRQATPTRLPRWGPRRSAEASAKAEAPRHALLGAALAPSMPLSGARAEESLHAAVAGRFHQDVAAPQLDLHVPIARDGRGFAALFEVRR